MTRPAQHKLTPKKTAPRIDPMSPNIYKTNLFGHTINLDPRFTFKCHTILMILVYMPIIHGTFQHRTDLLFLPIIVMAQFVIAAWRRHPEIIRLTQAIALSVILIGFNFTYIKMRFPDRHWVVYANTFLGGLRTNAAIVFYFFFVPISQLAVSQPVLRISEHERVVANEK
ncbi:unnamed protein product [Caenorhabditis sp. 36 PRJEB53466]|nr:unnamed protein product [Caenorhabditis sp. 36 PRJEB53466]